MTRPAHSLTNLLAIFEERTVMNKVVRWLAVLILLATTSACMDTHLHCEVPSGGDVNVLGRQTNG
jgi:hypothetical protein